MIEIKGRWQAAAYQINMRGKTLAKRIGRAAAALLLLALAAQTDIGEPFGGSTVAVPEGPLWLTWRELQSQMKADQTIVDRCRSEPQACPSAAALQFIAIVDEASAYENLARIGHINRAVNFAIRSINSAAAEGNIQSEWTAPLATLAAGAGDCKQFSVLKYAALIDAGFEPDDLRLLILNMKSRREMHAVVAVRNDGRWLILDNRSLALVDSNEILGQYIPVYALDHRGIRQFVMPPQVAEEIDGAPCVTDDRAG